MVRDPAFHIIESYISDTEPNLKPLEQVFNPNSSEDVDPEVCRFDHISVFASL